jgi:type I restriction enzyme S subunit
MPTLLSSAQSLALLRRFEGRNMTASMNVPQLRFPEFSGGWVEKKVKDISNLIDCEHKTAPYVDSSEFLVVRTNNIKNSVIDYIDIKYTTEKAYEDWTKRGKPVTGDILFTREAPAGESCLVPLDKKICLGQRLVLLKPENKIINSNFLVQFFNSFSGRNEISNYVIGTTVTRINIADIYKISCYIPSLPEQTKIASFLSAVDTKIDQLTQKKALLETYKKGAMQKIFSQQIRFMADDGEEYSEWEEKKLGEVAECLDNFRKPLNDEERQRMQGKYPYWGANNIMDYVDQYIFDETIVLLAEDGGNFDEYATRKIANLSHGKCWVNNHTHVLRGINLVMTNEFLYYSLVHKNITGFVSGGTRAKLTKGEMLKIPLITPSYEEQTKIANFLTAIDRKIYLVSQQLEQAKAFKKGLLQQMFV